MSTRENLNDAIIAESKAHIRYIASMLIAERDGKTRAANLFKALAEAEIIHAVNHLNVLGEMSSTEINIESGIAYELYEYTTMYPSYIDQAEKDGDRLAILSFRGAMAGEAAHLELLIELKRELNDTKDASYYICQKCGNIESMATPTECRVCGMSNDGIKEIR